MTEGPVTDHPLCLLAGHATANAEGLLYGRHTTNAAISTAAGLIEDLFLVTNDRSEDLYEPTRMLVLATLRLACAIGERQEKWERVVLDLIELVRTEQRIAARKREAA